MKNNSPHSAHYLDALIGARMCGMRSVHSSIVIPSQKSQALTAVEDEVLIIGLDAENKLYVYLTLIHEYFECESSSR